MFAALAALTPTHAAAATLTVVGGQLLGASGVQVDGALYDVVFVDGTCIDLFSACDDASDFTFSTASAASAASRALLDQVFRDGAQGQFDSVPGLTHGCLDTFVDYNCDVLTPYAVEPAATVHVGLARNEPAASAIGDVFGAGLMLAPSHATSNTEVWARWTSVMVPEPSTGLLVGLGLIAVGARRRTRVAAH